MRTALLVLACAGTCLAGDDGPNVADAYRKAFALMADDADDLGSNAAALEALKAIPDGGRCEFFEGAAITPTTELLHLARARKLGKVAVQAGKDEASKGHFAEAAAWHLRVLRMAQAVGNDRVLISRLVETALTNLAATGLLDVVRHPKCDAATRAETERVLSDILARRLPSADAFDAEEPGAHATVDQLFQLVGGGGMPSEEIEPEMKAFADQIRKGDPETRKKWHDEAQAMLAAYFADVEKTAVPGHLGELAAIQKKAEASAKASTSLAVAVFALFVPALGNATISMAKAEANLQGVRIVNALARVWTEGRGSPAALADLVPKYLPAVPNDPFDGKPFRYAKDGDACRIWSVGPDLADAGGTKACDDAKEEPGTDMIWELK